MAEFMKVMADARRLCRSYEKCKGCPNSAEQDDCLIAWLGATYATSDDIKRAEESVLAWAAENPSKTMLDVFYEHFPKAERLKNGTLRICPHHLDPSWGGLCDDGKTGDCRACWAREVEG